MAEQRYQKPKHIRGIGYYNHNECHVSISIHGVQHPLAPGQPVTDTNNHLVEYHPELETAVLEAKIIRRIEPDHHQFKDWNSRQGRGEVLRSFEEMSVEEIQSRVRDNRTAAQKKSAKPISMEVSSDKGNVTLPEGVEITMDKGMEMYKFDGKKFSSLASVDIYIKSKAKSKVAK